MQARQRMVLLSEEFNSEGTVPFVHTVGRRGREAFQLPSLCDHRRPGRYNYVIHRHRHVDPRAKMLLRTASWSRNSPGAFSTLHEGTDCTASPSGSLMHRLHSTVPTRLSCLTASSKYLQRLVNEPNQKGTQPRTVPMRRWLRESLEKRRCQLVACSPSSPVS